MLSGVTQPFVNAANRLWAKFVERTWIAPLLESVSKDACVLEIGGGYNPRFIKSSDTHIFHLDHCDTQTLRAKYAADPSVAHLIDRIQPIDFVFNGAPIETLVPPNLRFDLIYGSHVLEHQVDLIGHLQSLEKLLKPGGRIVEIIPDLRLCFDCLRFPTVISDVLPAHLRHAQVHQGRQIFDCMSRGVDKNLCRRMLDSDFEKIRLASTLQNALEVMVAAESPGQIYHDIHAWTFTPDSFRLLMIELRLISLIKLTATFVSFPFGVQFCAVLERAPKEFAALTAQEIQGLEKERLSLMLRVRI